ASLQCVHRCLRSDLSKTDRSACAQLRCLALSEEPSRIEDAGEKIHAGISTKRSVTLEERHLLSAGALADLAVAKLQFDSWNSCRVSTRGEHFYSRDSHVAIAILEGTLESLHRSTRCDLR